LTGIVGLQGLRKTRRRSVQCLFTSLTAATVAWQPSGRSLRFYRIRPAEPCGSVSFVSQQKGATISESNFFSYARIVSVFDENALLFCFFLLYVGDDFKRFERFCFRYSNACTEQLRSKYRLFSSVHVLWANLYAP